MLKVVSFKVRSLPINEILLRVMVWKQVKFLCFGNNITKKVACTFRVSGFILSIVYKKVVLLKMILFHQKLLQAYFKDTKK